MRKNVVSALAVLAATWAGSLPSDAAGLAVECVKLGGTVRFEIGTEGEDLVWTVTFPRSVSSYLGGFEGGTKPYSAGVELYLDTDDDPGTGLEGDPMFEPGAQGAEVLLSSQEIETSLARGADGSWINGAKLDLTVERDGESAELPDGVYPEWEVGAGDELRPVDWVHPPDTRAITLRLPRSTLGLGPGAKVRATGVVPLCRGAFPFAGTAEATLTLD